MSESILMSVSDVRGWLRPCVYIARLGHIVQYVGESSHGILRPLDPQHHVMSLPTFQYDSLEIIWQESKELAVALQNKLIYQHSPQFNIMGITPPRSTGDGCQPCLWHDPNKREFVVLARRTLFEKKGAEIFRSKDRAEAKQRLREVLKAEKQAVAELWKANAKESKY